MADQWMPDYSYDESVPPGDRPGPDARSTADVSAIESDTASAVMYSPTLTPDAVADLTAFVSDPTNPPLVPTPPTLPTPPTMPAQAVAGHAAGGDWWLSHVQADAVPNPDVSPVGAVTEVPSLGGVTQEDVKPYLLRPDIAPKSGGTATVYVARDQFTQRDLAIKVFRADFGRRVAHEATVYGSLDQVRGVVPVLHSGEARDGRPWLAMKYINGGSLHDLVHGNSGRPLGVEAVTRMWILLASTLAIVHSRNVIHRDVKPENILISTDGPLLADFGIASAPNCAESEVSGDLSPRYAAPERVNDRQSSAKPAEDIYSLAASMYFAATGDPPFGTERGPDGLTGLLQRVKAGDLAPVLQRVPPELQSVFAQCLASDPASRPRTASDVVRLLEAVVLDAPRTDPSFSSSAGATILGNVDYGYVEILTPAPGSSAADEASSAKSRRTVVGVSLAVALALIGAAVLYVVFGPSKDDPRPNPTTSTASAPALAAPTIESFGPSGQDALALRWSSESPESTVVTLTEDGGKASFPLPLTDRDGIAPFEQILGSFEVDGAKIQVDNTKHTYCATLKVLSSSGYVDSEVVCTTAVVD